MSELIINCFNKIPKTGVIYVMSEANKKGFFYGNKSWSNLGQGAPEIGEIPNCAERINNICFNKESYEYSPVSGDVNLKNEIANLYNERYRKNKTKYKKENIAVSSGGRLALTRVLASISNVNIGHFLPDYTAYEELLDVFKKFVPIPISHSKTNNFKPSCKEIEKYILEMGLSAILISNPCNPTGQILDRKELKELVNICKNLKCTLIIDEFYSHYLYGENMPLSLSASEFVENIEEDGVIIIDGLTKNWRYPGLRISWTFAPSKIIDCISSAGSFLDGGATHIIQNIASNLVNKNIADKEAQAIQEHFLKKRDYTLQRILKMGFILDYKPQGAFYCFPSLENLKKPLQDGMDFFKILLDEKVITVPGIFFDVNPGSRRNLPSRLKNYIRISYGPSFEELKLGLDKMEKVIKQF